MGRMVYCPLDDLQVTDDADQDIWEIMTASTNKAILHGWELTSAATTAEAVQLRLLRGSDTGNGSPATPVKADDDDGAITASVDSLALIPGADEGILQTFRWEQLGPLGQIYTPEMRIIIPESSYLKLNLETALAGTTEWDGWICWEEF